MAAEGTVNTEDKNVTNAPEVDEENTNVIVDSNAEVADTTEAPETSEEDTEVVAEGEPKAKLGMGGILKAISKAVRDGNMSSKQARQIRGDLGILGSFFTKQQPNVKARRAQRKAAKKARKVTRRNGYKGQKMNKGVRR